MADTDLAVGKAKKTKKAKPKSAKPKDDEIPLADMNGESKSKFQSLLEQAVDQAKEGAKRKKKKKDDSSESVLESLRKGEGLQKDEDAAIKANTYDPDNSPKNEKSNKRRQKLKESEGKDNKAYEKENLDLIDETQTKPKKKKKKPKMDDENEMDGEESNLISDLAKPVAAEQKKKKKKEPPDGDTSRPMSPTESEGGEGKTVKKKKKKPVSEVDEEEHPLSPTEDEPVKGGKKKKKKTEETDEPKSPKEGKKKKKTNIEEETDDVKEPMSPKGEKKKKKKTATQEEDQDERPQSPEEEPSTSKGGKKKKKKDKGEEEALSPRTEDDEETTADVKKKKKKKKKEDQDVMSQDEEKTEEETEEKTEETATPKKKPKKKKQPALDEAEREELRKKRLEIEDKGDILAVTIHRTDKLKNDFHIMHPLVRVHMVDEDTGEYLDKQHKDRAVTAYFENQNENVEKVLPIMTQPFDFKQQKSVLPVWEELLLFNENFNYFTKTDPRVVVFFELLDFISMNTASRRYSGNSEGGWHRIAWAFLKVLGNNDKLNTGSKVRLQLFEPPYNYRAKPGQVEVYQWWKTQARKAYPSTLYVTLKGITPPNEVEPAMRSMFATQQEVGSKTYEEFKKTMGMGEKTRKDHHKVLSSWTRLVGQTCRIPNTLYLTLQAGRKGCYVIKFSHDGRSLACACHDRDTYPILVYEIPTGELRGKFTGHFGLVYDLCWSKRDTHLLSASADGTCRVWSIESYGDHAEKILPHPGYVYCAKFHPRIDTLIATGGYDQVIRIWDVQGEDRHGVLKQEIENHRGHVNTLCFDDDGQKLYSGDSIGIIIVWNAFATEQPTHRDVNPQKDKHDDLTDRSDDSALINVTQKSKVKGFIRDWTVYQKIAEPDLKDTSINHIQLHHSGRRLMVHCRDNIIRMFDLRVQRIMQKYIGALNFREKIGSSITPCGSFVFAGSEDNCVYAWNTETGDQVAMYSELNFRHPVTDVVYHPRDHMFAACSLGDNQPVVIYNYDPHVAQKDAGLSPRQIIPESQEYEELGGTSPMGSPRKMDDTPSGRVMSKDEFNVQTTSRLEKVMKKLNTATIQMATMPSMDLPGVVDSPSIAHTGYLANFDSSLTPRSMMATPQQFTPHAPRTMTGIMHQQQFASQNMYLKSSDSDWRPGFSEVGRYGARSSSPTFIGRPPHLSLTASHGKAQFSFQAPAGKAVPHYKQVVALYDYRAQRSDELTIFKGDVISVLYKDNDNWWMGELPDGQQGFFPSNYVAEEGEYDEDQLRIDSGRTLDDDSAEETPKKTLTAVKTKSGELKFVSGTDSEEDMIDKPKRNRRRKKRGSQDSTLDETQSVESKGSRKSVTINESNA